MQARRLPAERGTFWLLEGFRLFRRNPPLITALTLTYLMVVQSLVILLPGIGPILLPLLLPTLTLIVANGCRLVDEGRAPGKAALLNGISGNGRAMFRLGIWQLAGAVLLVLVSMAVNNGNDPFANLDPAPPVSLVAPPTPAAGEDQGTAGPSTEMAVGSATNTAKTAEAGQNVGGDAMTGHTANAEHEAAILGALLRLMLLAAPLILAFWFAPFLTGWDRVTPLKAIFFSAVATWRNWRALGMFGVGVIVVAGIVPGLILIVASQVAGLALSVAFIAMRMVLVFLVAPVLTASIYISYRDIFHPTVDENA